MLEGNPKIDRERFHLAEHYRQDYVAVVPQGITPENIEKSDYWSVVVNIMRPGGRIEVEGEDGSWSADCKILLVGPTWAKVKVLHVYRYETGETPKDAPLDYRVYWRGRHHRWAVQRMSDGEIIKNNLGSQSLAEDALAQHRKAMMM